MLVQNKVFKNYFGGKVYKESLEIHYPPKKTLYIYIYISKVFEYSQRCFFHLRIIIDIYQLPKIPFL